MKNETNIKTEQKIKYHKSSGYKQSVNLFKEANKAVFTDKLTLINTGRLTANKVVLMITLNITPQPSDVEVLESDHNHNLHVYPNGILQVTFEDFLLSPGNGINFTYRINTGKTDMPKEKIIKNIYLFFCY
ncbi:MAG TPA: hypothetical protein VJ946_10125 [Bacteroidales bacterium]|nr:hypothetical protein [Bacteroidales bacterium]